MSSASSRARARWTRWGFPSSRSLASTGYRAAVRVPAGLAAGAQYVPRQGGRARADHAADGAAACRRRSRPTPRVRAARPGRLVSVRRIRHPDSLHDGLRRYPGRDVRGHAVPGHRGRGRHPLSRPPLRGGRPVAGRRLLDGVRPRDPAAPLAPPSSPARCSAGLARWESSGPPSLLRATSPAARRPCRSPFTSAGWETRSAGRRSP